MILFFSATGNSRHTAEEISRQTGDELINIEDCEKEERYDFTLSEGENIGLITPVYFWILPSVVEKFLKNMKIHSRNNRHYTFLVVTYGTTPGASISVADDYLKKAGCPLKAMYTVQMPDTWTPVFDLSDPEKIRKQNEKADLQILGVTKKILAKQEGDFSDRRLPRILAAPARASYESARMTSHLHAEDSCIGCGLCARNCPVQAIEMQDQKPVWVKKKCSMCLRCLHCCPRFAIQYDNKTKKHGQYVHPQL